MPLLLSPGDEGRDLFAKWGAEGPLRPAMRVCDTESHRAALTSEFFFNDSERTLRDDSKLLAGLGL